MSHPEPFEIYECYSGLGEALDLPPDLAVNFVCEGIFNPTMSPVWLVKEEPSSDDLDFIADLTGGAKTKSEFDQKKPFINILYHPDIDSKTQIRSLKKAGWVSHQVQESKSLLVFTNQLELDFDPEKIEMEYGTLEDADLEKEIFKQLKVNFNAEPAYLTALKKMIKRNSKNHFGAILKTSDGKAITSGLVCVNNHSAYLYSGSVAEAFRGKGFWKKSIAARQAVSGVMGAGIWATTTHNSIIQNAGDFNYAIETFVRPSA